MAQLLLICQQLLHKRVIGPRGPPLVSHKLSGICGAEALLLHHIGNDEDGAAGDGGGAVHQGGQQATALPHFTSDFGRDASTYSHPPEPFGLLREVPGGGRGFW